MTQGQFLMYLALENRLCSDMRFHGDALLLELITTPPLGYSLYERKAS